MFQKAIGEHRDSKGRSLEDRLVELANDPEILNSIELMRQDLRNGNYNLDPNKSYVHNKIIKQLFRTWRKKGWSAIRLHPEVQRLYWEKRYQKSEEAKRLRETKNPEELLLPTR